MSQTRTFPLLLALGTGILAGLPAATVADDTEIYVGSSSLSITQGVRPNVLLILDTSGSMSGLDGTGITRLDRMKTALKQILDAANNINVGLMRFSNPGGPILYPVSYIDDDADTVEGGGTTSVNVRITAGGEDVEEFLGAPLPADPFYAGSTRLSLGSTPGFGPSTTLSNIRISHGRDDAEEIISSGNTESTTSTGGIDRTRMVLGSDRLGGLVFRNLALPPAAQITGATITLDARDTDATDARLEFFGWAATLTDDSVSFPVGTGAKGISSQDRAERVIDGVATTISTNWDVPPWSSTTSPASLYTSPDLSRIVQAIVDRPDWPALAVPPSGDLGFIIAGEGQRRARTRENSSTRTARLDVSFANGPAGEQLVGLRFQGVNIPQGAAITEAYLEVYPARTLSEAVSLRVYGELPAGGSAAPFDGIAEKPSDKKNRATAPVDWHITETWVADGPSKLTPDLKDLVQEIVGDPNWCGGNDLALMIERVSGAWRSIYSHEADPALVPVLRINYDKSAETPAGGGCIVQSAQRQVNTSNDDVIERVSDGTMTRNGSLLALGTSGTTPYHAGVRFQDVRIEPGAEILDARLVFTAAGDDSSTANFTIRGEAGDTTSTYGSAKFNLSSRPTTTAAVSWATGAATDPVTAWATNGRYTSPNLAPIVQELVCRGAPASDHCPGNGGNWQAGNSMNFMFSGTGLRRPRSFDGSAADAPVLQVTLRGRVGDGTATTLVTVRQRLKEVVDDLAAGGWTPIVDTLYEAAKYYRGEEVVYGRYRGAGRDGVVPQRSTRLSHPASYSGGTVDYPSGCAEDDSNLNADACRGQRILGSPVYESPIYDPCGTNYVILLTDGQANYNHSAGTPPAAYSSAPQAAVDTRVQNLTGAACRTTLLDNTSPVAAATSWGDGDERCGLDLVEFLRKNDQASFMAGDQGIVTYTVGFNFSGQWLEDLAIAGGGQYQEASDAAQLANTLTTFFADILKRSTSFAAPALSVNAFNRLYHRDEIYLSIFEPDDRVRWPGNVKKFKLCANVPRDNDTGEALYIEETTGRALCEAPNGELTKLGTPIDQTGAVAIGADDRIKETAHSFWSSLPDGGAVTRGGAAENVPAHGSRRIFTFTGTYPEDGTPVDALLPEFRDANNDGILDSLTAGDDDENLQRMKDLFALPPFDKTVATMPTSEKDALRDALRALLAWVRGQDVDDEDNDEDTNENRFVMGDPLHGSPLTVTFGFDADAKVVDDDGKVLDDGAIIKLFSTSNDGSLRLINGHTGVEEWAFFPQELLGIQQTLRSNPTGNHVYGLDGSPTLWVRDVNQDGVIDPAAGDFIRVYVGMRRGGEYLYAIDATPTSKLTNREVVNGISPRLMWRIAGGAGDYPNLGQTWSRPFVTRVRVGTTTEGQSLLQTALVFAGGYDPAQDVAFGNPGVGNAIYVANAETGARLLSVSSDDPGDGDRVVVPDMQYPIPSDLALMDSDGDGATDRLYVGDTAGQVWRVDLDPNLTETAGIRAVVGKLAEVSDLRGNLGVVNPRDRRKFFYRPDVVQVADPSSLYSDVQRYDLVTLVSGDRPNPLGMTVQDRAFAFRDVIYGRMTDTDGDGLADNYTTIQGPLDGTQAPPVEGEEEEPAEGLPPVSTTLFDASLINLDEAALIDPLNPTQPSEAALELRESDGWFLNLPEPGEKGFAASVVLAGKLFFTTYLPEGVVDASACSLSPGSGRLYGLNVLSAAAAFDWSEGKTGIFDRYVDSADVLSDPQGLFQEAGISILVGAGGGILTIDPDIGLPRVQTYWYQED